MKSQKQIKLLTLNVFLRPPPIKTNQDDYKEQRFQQILKIINNYDIVCFQQMFQTATFRPERIIEFAIQNKFYYWKSSEPPSFFPGPVVDSGLLIISKFPILFSYFQSYNLGILSDSASDKGYIYCKIQVNSDIMHLFFTHLQASYKLPGKQFERQLSVKTRLHQFNYLLQRIYEHLANKGTQEHELVILAGDLNIDSNQKPYQLSTNSYLKKSKEPREMLKISIEGTANEIFLNEDGGFIQFLSVLSILQHNKIDFIDHAYVKNNKQHPVTFGDNEYVLTGKEDVTSFQSLDYIFTLKVPGFSTENTKLNAVTESCTVQQFKFPGTPYGQISDHYGMSIIIDS